MIGHTQGQTQAVPHEQAAGGQALGRQSQVSLHAERLEKCIEEAGCLVNDLENRLAAVLLPQSPKTPDGAVPNLVDEDLVPLAERLYELAKRVSVMRNRLADILSRIEL